MNGRVDYSYDTDPETGPEGAIVPAHMETFAAMGRLEAFVDVEFEDDGWVDQARLAYGLRGALDKPNGYASGMFQVMSLEIRHEPSGRVKTSVGGAAPQRRLGTDLTLEEATVMHPALPGAASLYADYIAFWSQPWAGLGVVLEAH